MLISPIVVELCPGQDFLKGEIIKKWGLSELGFFCTALIPNEIFLPTKFHVDISDSFSYFPGQNFSKRGDNSKMGLIRVMVLLHCTSTQ
jgi:hypothetical protein